jgi:hypothetical protein
LRISRAIGAPVVRPAKDSGQNLDGIGLAPLRHMPRGPRLAAIEFGLDVGLADRQSRRAAIDHAADRRPVRLTK